MGIIQTCNVNPLETHNLAADYADKVKILSKCI
ncbi:arylsulfatase [Salmonella enterica subsp. enterica]|uniref:Arylsulfatase n=1 Tax=Salmonella enterica I TaxID=59201 RepID=A0A3S4IGW0_SALET|nr:arylsulfatase [Salmonella enterica subsp. enterica]